MIFNKQRSPKWHRLPADDLLPVRLKLIGETPMPRFGRLGSGPSLILVVATIAALGIGSLGATNLSPVEARQIGKKIWQNECNGTISGLTSWNSGENFASLGIGHFIWYPPGERGPFEESFPQLIVFLASRGTIIPSVIAPEQSPHCPWKNRSEFLKAQDSEPMKELRQFLMATVDLQSQFLVNRLENSLPKMLEETSAPNRIRVRANFERLLKTSQGCYALVDYVNFKGEGVLHSERYQGQGWGLLQVLEQMKTDPDFPETEFSRAAASVLERRVQNAPPARNEKRWLAGWLKRVNSYSRD
jgi:hypothetical protein